MGTGTIFAVACGEYGEYGPVPIFQGTDRYQRGVPHAASHLSVLVILLPHLFFQPEKPLNGYMAGGKVAQQAGDPMLYAQIFLYLQVLDFLTTLIGFKLGAAEMSPFVRYLLHFGPIAGVAVSKLMAVFVAGL